MSFSVCRVRESGRQIKSLYSEELHFISIKKLSDFLGSSVSSVEGKARRMGLRKSGVQINPEKNPNFEQYELMNTGRVTLTHALWTHDDRLSLALDVYATNKNNYKLDQ